MPDQGHGEVEALTARQAELNALHNLMQAARPLIPLHDSSPLPPPSRRELSVLRWRNRVLRVKLAWQVLRYGYHEYED